MTVREINKAAHSGKPVIAVYIVDGLEQQGRIIHARNKGMLAQVQLINSHRWVDMKSSESVWIAK